MLRGVLPALLAVLLVAAPARGQQPDDADVLYLPTPPRVVEAMLGLAALRPGDLLYDLGSGDGRIPIAAARRGVRGIGIELDSRRLAEARRNARAAQVETLVEFRQEDALKADLAGATVVTLFLFPDINRALRAKLERLPPGTRIVSHRFGIGDWRPDRTLDADGHPLLLWIVPPR